MGVNYYEINNMSKKSCTECLTVYAIVKKNFILNKRYKNK